MLCALPDPSTAVFQTRAGLTALELDPDGRCADTLGKTITEVARLDAYAARDVLHHPIAASILDTGSAHALNAVIAAAGLESGVLPAHHHQALKGAVIHASAELERLLKTEPEPR